MELTTRYTRMMARKPSSPTSPSPGATRRCQRGPPGCWRAKKASTATEVSVNTAFGVERVVRDAFERATRRRNKITLLHKHNVLVNAGGLWRRLFESVAAEYPGVTTDYLHIDAAMIFLVTDPQRFDVIVTDNLFGDIVTDLAAAVTGGIGLAASGNVNPVSFLRGRH